MVHSTAEETLATQAAARAAEVVPPADVVLRRLAACLAHHVNNSLTGVIGYLELSLRDTGNKGNHQAHLQEGLSCAYQAAETVRRLVAFASEKRASARLGLVSLHQLAEQAANELRTTPTHSRSVNVTGDAAVAVRADASLLRLAVEQVVRNAVEATPHGGEIHLHVENGDGAGRLHVSDNGPGLSAEAARHLFDPFWTTKTNGHLGLGLVLSRDVLAAQGGSLTVQNRAGAGATVTLALPAASPEQSPQCEPATVLAPSSGALVSTPG